ncbi:MAG: alanine/ornithine racemase family PLP-dependent enzyme [Anaerolineales bacterium]|nr:MAG: alanine/ornithine racemase family PLP-dependent enzyme [Anaerolineales bacterium]
MMRIEVDCERIRCNAEAVIAMGASQSIEVVGVTKACCGHPDVARAMLAGGVKILAESRLKNVRRLRKANIDAPIMLLRLPSPDEADQVVRLTQVSLNSEVGTVHALSRAAKARGLIHQVILMVETGDRREGVMPDKATDTAREIARLPGIDLLGIGTNLAGMGGVLPTKKKSEMLIDVAKDIEHALGIRLAVISGGHTVDLDLILVGEMPARVNQLRIGEAILLGVNGQSDLPLPLPHQDAFQVVAEVIEIKTKPSLPEGQIVADAFGRVSHWEDLGFRRRALLAIGEQDMRVSSLRPKRRGVTMVGASSDLLVLDVTEADPPVNLGEELEFAPAYAAVATAMANNGVTQVIKPAKLAKPALADESANQRIVAID